MLRMASNMRSWLNACCMLELQSHSVKPLPNVHSSIAECDHTCAEFKTFALSRREFQMPSDESTVTGRKACPLILKCYAVNGDPHYSQ
jgi:hypothetical protein